MLFVGSNLLLLTRSRLEFDCFAKHPVSEMLLLGNLTDAVIGRTECMRVVRTASRAKFLILKFFYKGVIGENVLALIGGESRGIGTWVGANGYVWRPAEREG